MTEQSIDYLNTEAEAKASLVQKRESDIELSRNGVVGTALTFVSIIVGGGVVSVPYAYTAAGFYMGLCVNFSVMAVMVFSASLYLDAKQRLKCPSTFTAVAQECIGNISSFLVNFIIAFCIFGVITLYSILFSRMSMTLFGG